jgi:protein-S-isoprenylcysteine O-methyltransferase Ste14
MGPTAARWVFIAVFGALSLLRLYFRARAGLFREPPFSPTESAGLIVARSVLGAPLAAATVAYCFFPSAWTWAIVLLPGILRAAGAILAAGALCLLLSVHFALGKGFATWPAPRTNQHLVTKGPYALVRHPMYAAYFVLFVGAFLLSGSWLMGSSGLAVIVLLMTLRRRREEELLSLRFGEEYERYRRATGMFIPRQLTFRRRR